LNVLLIFLVASAFPSQSKTAWMDPASFHLRVGMTERQAATALREHGWKTEQGKVAGETVVSYDQGRTITVVTEKGKVRSIRFEFVGYIPDVEQAFAERQKALRREFGKPAEHGKGSMLIWEKTAPNVIAVLSTHRETSYGKQGLGLFVVRYFEPPVE
jgi:hypothetical protein